MSRRPLTQRKVARFPGVLAVLAERIGEPIKKPANSWDRQVLMAKVGPAKKALIEEFAAGRVRLWGKRSLHDEEWQSISLSPEISGSLGIDHLTGMAGWPVEAREHEITYWHDVRVEAEPLSDLPGPRATPPSAGVEDGNTGARSAAPATLALMRAWSAYLDADEELTEDMKPGALARRVADFAMERGITDAHLLNPRNFTTRDLLRCALEGIQQTRRRDRG